MRTKDGAAWPLSESEIAEVLKNNAVFSIDGKSLARSGEIFLSFSNGELWLKNPTERDLEDMLALATTLKCRVGGDELETYRSPTESYVHVDDSETLASDQRQLKSIKAATRKRQWLLNASVFGFFVLLMAIFRKMGWLD
jgi:hypothetical protein